MTTGRINQVATVVGERPQAGGRAVVRSASHTFGGARTVAELASHSYDDQTEQRHSRNRSFGARTDRAAAEAVAAAQMAGARFSRLRGTRCGAGILKTVRFVTKQDVSHTVRISTARRRKGSQPTRRLPDRWHAGPGRSRASSRLPRSRDRVRRSNVAKRIRRRSTSYQPTDKQVDKRRITKRHTPLVALPCSYAALSLHV